MVERVSMKNIKSTLQVIFFGQNDNKEVPFKFASGEAPDGEELPKGEWLRFFPGEEDLAGREVNERLQSGVLETYIEDIESGEKAVLSIPESAVAAIRRAIEREGYDIDRPETWENLIFTMQRKGRNWKVEIKDEGETEQLIREALQNLEGQKFETLDELALQIGVEHNLEDIEEIKGILKRLKGTLFTLSKKGLKIKSK